MPEALKIKCSGLSIPLDKQRSKWYSLSMTNNKATLLESRYDRDCNRTFAKVETAEFTEWYDIHGFCPKANILTWLMPFIERRLAAVA